MIENEDILRLIDTLLKVEALHAGATTPGERDAAASAIERIKKKLQQFIESDPPIEMQCTFSNTWSKQLFCALAKRYDIQPYRYYRQRYTTVMIRVPRKFLDEVLWPEFQGLNKVLTKYLDDMTSKIISEAIYKGSTEEDVVKEQPLLENAAVPSKTPLQTLETPKKSVPEVQTTPQKTQAVTPSNPVVQAQDNGLFSRKHVGRNDLCPCGSGKKYKRCCKGRR